MKFNRQQIESSLKEFLKVRSEILFAYVFGSFAGGKDFQDIDVGIYISDLTSIGDSFDFAFQMSGDLERLLGCSVDVIVLNTAPDHLIHSVSNGILILNRDDDVRVTFLSSSWSRYFDIRVKREAYLQAIAGEQSSYEPT